MSSDVTRLSGTGVVHKSAPPSPPLKCAPLTTAQMCLQKFKMKDHFRAYLKI